jgi:hypothetical protein
MSEESMIEDEDEYRTYSTALKAAGARVLAYKEFGSYQGDWLAKVEYDGRVFWLRDYFGSCSGCDALEAELGYEDPKPGQLAIFGKRYLNDEPLTFDEVLKAVSENVGWDSDAEEMVAFVRENA